MTRSFSHYTDGPRVYLTTFGKYFLESEKERYREQPHSYRGSAFQMQE